MTKRFDTQGQLHPGRELAVLATLRQLTARDLAHRAGLPEWRVGRILKGTARPKSQELARLRGAVFAEVTSSPTAGRSSDDGWL